MVDWTISLGNIITLSITIMSAAIVSVTFIYRWGVDMSTLTNRLEQVDRTLSEHSADLKKIQEVMLIVARNDERLNALDQRISDMQKIRDEWRLDVAKRLADISHALAEMYRSKSDHTLRVP